MNHDTIPNDTVPVDTVPVDTVPTTYTVVPVFPPPATPQPTYVVINPQPTYVITGTPIPSTTAVVGTPPVLPSTGSGTTVGIGLIGALAIAAGLGVRRVARYRPIP